MTDIANILVAEDNDFVRLQIVKFLQDACFCVFEASDGSEALSVINAEKIDLVIVDVRMEPVDGFDFLRSMRAMDVNIPAILVTGDHSPDILEKSGDLGVSAMLVKPVEKERLIEAAKRSLGIKSGAVDR